MGNYKYHYLLLVFSINASSGWLVGQLLSFFSSHSWCFKHNGGWNVINVTKLMRYDEKYFVICDLFHFLCGWIKES